MIVKRCGIDDIEEIYKIEEDAFSDPIKKETFLKDMMRESFYCYGLYEDEAVAFISFEKVLDEGQIISVATHSAYRQKGYAKKLFCEVLSLCENLGIKVFTLEVRSDNSPAISLYESMGFERVGVRKNYYRNPCSDAILMDLHLGDE